MKSKKELTEEDLKLIKKTDKIKREKSANNEIVKK